MNREQKYVHFRKLKSQIQKKYRTAKTVSRNGKFCVEYEGRNLLQGYPDLAVADNVYDAWKNTSIVLHWDKIDTRNSRTLKNDISAVTVIDEVKRASDKDRHKRNRSKSECRPQEGSRGSGGENSEGGQEIPRRRRQIRDRRRQAPFRRQKETILQVGRGPGRGGFADGHTRAHRQNKDSRNPGPGIEGA